MACIQVNMGKPATEMYNSYYPHKISITITVTRSNSWTTLISIHRQHVSNEQTQKITLGPSSE